MSRLLRLKTLDFVSSLAVECSGGVMGHGSVSLPGDLDPLPILREGHPVGREESCFLPKVSLQKMEFRVEYSLQVTGKMELSLGFGA